MLISDWSSDVCSSDLLIVSRGLAYGMAEPARHSLYTRMPRSVRYKGQNTVDTAVWRFGDVAIASGMNGLRTIGMAAGGFPSLRAVAALEAAAIGCRLARGTVPGRTQMTGSPAACTALAGQPRAATC